MDRNRAATALLVATVTVLGLAAPATALQFRFPVDNAGGTAIWSAWIIGLDHDPEPGEDRSKCLNHDGLRNFPFCYDGHHGTDFLLEGGFDRMDAGSATILAAADGVVVRVVDGNYDRCHGDFQSFDVTCDGHERRSNYVAIEHAGGWRTEYHHMKRGSPMVEEGDVVRCGDPLGLIGSSGYSTAPHLHFQVFTPDGDIVDPYSGVESQPESFWVEEEGPDGLPVERCEGEEPPPPDVVEGDVVEADVVENDVVAPRPDVVAPGPDVVEPGEPDAVETTEPEIEQPPPDLEGPLPGLDAGARPDASVDADAWRADTSGLWHEEAVERARSVGCAAGDGGAAGGDPALLFLIALLLGSFAVRQARSRSPRCARVARSASARSSRRRTTSASS